MTPIDKAIKEQIQVGLFALLIVAACLPFVVWVVQDDDARVAAYRAELLRQCTAAGRVVVMDECVLPGRAFLGHGASDV